MKTKTPKNIRIIIILMVVVWIAMIFSQMDYLQVSISNQRSLLEKFFGLNLSVSFIRPLLPTPTFSFSNILKTSLFLHRTHQKNGLPNCTRRA